MVEYGLILALIAVVAIVALHTIGAKVNGTFGKVNTEMSAAGITESAGTP